MLLTNVVEKYLKLDDEERASFEALMATPEGKEVKMVVSVYEERGIEKGIKQDIEQGIAQGVELGVARGKCSTLLRLMERKFGTIPDDVRTRMEAITDVEELDRLLDVILMAGTLEEIGL